MVEGGLGALATVEAAEPGWGGTAPVRGGGGEGGHRGALGLCRWYGSEREAGVGVEDDEPMKNMMNSAGS